MEYEGYSFLLYSVYPVRNKHQLCVLQRAICLPGPVALSCAFKIFTVSLFAGSATVKECAETVLILRMRACVCVCAVLADCDRRY